MKFFNAIMIFAAGFAVGTAIARKDIDRKCNEIVEKEFEAFKEFRKEKEEKAKQKDEEETEKEEYEEITKTYSESSGDTHDEETDGTIIQKSEYGLLDYQMMKIELFGDMSVEDTYGNVIKDPESVLGITDLHDLFESDDQNIAYVRNDKTCMYYEVIREV